MSTNAPGPFHAHPRLKGPMPRRTAGVRSCGQLCDICVAPRGALCYRHDLFTANIDSGDGMPIQLPGDHPDSLIACMYMSTPHSLHHSIGKSVRPHRTKTSQLQPWQRDCTFSVRIVRSIRET